MEGVRLLTVAVLVWSCWIPLLANAQSVGFTLSGTMYTNNSVVTITEIRTGSAALLCTTTLLGCCYSSHGGGWFLPNRGEIVNDVSLPYYRTRARNPGTILLHRNAVGTTTGLFRCDIPDASGLQSLYVGIYNSTTGLVMIQGDIDFHLDSEPNTNPPVFTLTCTSTGGPATTVSWTRGSSTLSDISQIVTDTVTGTYVNTLRVAMGEAGTYVCTVSNSRSSATTNLTVVEANPPTNLDAVQVDPTNIQVSWTAPASGATVMGYRIYYDNGTSIHSVDVSTNATDHNLTIPQPQSRLNYSITIVALSSHLPSTVVGPAPVIVDPPPTAPDVTPGAATPTSVVVSWSPQTPVDSYEISFQRATGNQQVGDCSSLEHSGNVSVGGSITMYNLTDLQEFSTYLITVIAVNREGSNESNPVSVNTQMAAPTSGPEMLRAVEISSTNIIVAWDAVNCTERNSNITGYVVRYTPPSASGNDSVMVAGTGDAGGMVTIDGLTPSTQYSIQVVAVNSNGDVGVPSTSLSVNTSSASAPSMPTIMLAESLSPTSINLTWTQPMEDIVSSYEIVYSYQGPCSGFAHTNTTTVEGTSRNYTLSGLQEFSNYAVSVTAMNDAGNATDTVTATTLSAAPSGMPQEVNIVATGTTTISIKWNAIDCTDRNSEISGYRVRYGPLNGTTLNDSIDDPLHTMYRATGLMNSTDYTFEVAAESSSGTGPFSDPIIAQTTSTSAPSILTVMAESLSPTTINLTWTQPVGDFVSSYEIVYSYQGPCSGFAHTNTTTVEGTSRNYTLSGLQEFSNYTVSVTAMNDAGNATTTTTEAITTLSAVPSGVPQAVLAVATGSSSIFVQWDRVNCIERNSEITGYTIRYAPSDGVPSDIIILGTTRSNRTFTILGLNVSNYTVMVAADIGNMTRGPFSTAIFVKILGVGLTLNSTTLANNSILTNTDIGTSAIALVCTTTYRPCCSSSNTETQWYFPNGNPVPNTPTLPYRRTRGPGVGTVILSRRSESTTTGIFHCDLPDDNGILQSLYVGIYTSTTGLVMIPDEIDFQLDSEPNTDPPVFTLTCTSTGGPATTVFWTRGSSTRSGTFQNVTDTVTGTYVNTLRVAMREAGTYVCNVSNSRSSATADLTVVAANPPTNLNAVQVDPTSIQVSWTAPASGATVIGYHIYYDSGTSTGSVDVSANATDHNLTIPRPQSRLNYSITIVALSAHLPSTVVGPALVTIDPPPTAPNVILGIVTPTSVVVSWSPQTSVDSYEISFQLATGNQQVGDCTSFDHSDNVSVGGNITMYNLSGLQEFTTYFITVTAVNREGSNESDPVSVNTQMAAPTSAPEMLRAVEISSTNIIVAWDAVNCTERNSNITGYVVRYTPPSTSGNDSVMVAGTGDAGGMVTIDGLAPSTQYSIQVAAVNSNGSVGVSTAPLSVNTLSVSASSPSAPTVMAESLFPTSITLTWTQTVEDIVSSYEIVFSYQGPCSGFTHTNTTTVEGTSRNYTLSGLQEFSNYTVSVTAMNDAGNATTTTTEAITTLSAVPSGVPQAVLAVAIGSSSIFVQWDRVSCIERNSEITGYTIRYNSSGGVSSDMTTSGTTRSDRTFTVTGLNVANYVVMVAADTRDMTTGPFSTAIPVEILVSGVGVTLNGVTLTNNSIVTNTDIGTGAAALVCTTTYTHCCTSTNQETQWYFPNGSQVPNNPALPYQRNRGPFTGRVNLNRNFESTITGIFHCDIPDASGVTQSLYVGIYDSGTGILAVTSLQFQLTTDLNATTTKFILTCISTGGPVTTFSWRRDGALVTNNNSYNIAPQRITDAESGTYTHILTVTGRRPGQYECSVTNNRPSMEPGSLTVEAADPPTGLNVEPVNPTSIRVSWTAPISVATVTGYRIYYQARGVWGSVSVDAGVTNTTLRNLQDDLTYNITIVALSMHLPSPVVGPRTVTLELAPLTIEVIGLDAAIAGQTINLTCTVNRRPNVSETPNVQWLGSGVNLLLSESGGIMVDSTTMVNSSAFSRTLWFTPAQTSHGGLYTCQAMADSVTVTKAIDVTVQISRPNVTIVPDRVGPLYIGTSLNLTCIVQFSSIVVDTNISVNISWNGPNGEIDRGTIVTDDQALTYSSTITIRITNSGTYNCSAIASPDPPVTAILASERGMATHNLTGIDLQHTVTISESGTAVSGNILNLTCAVNVSIPPVVQWIYPNDTVITNSNWITVGPPVRADNITNLNLIFEPLVTSHGGQYTCQSEVDVASSARYSTRNITVQIAPPPLSISPERIDSSLIVNQNLALTCTALMSQYVDISVAVVFIWIGPKGVLPMNTQQAYMSTVTVSRLQTNDSGTYTCSAAVRPTVSSPFVVASTNATRLLNITVVELLQIITFSESGTGIAGDTFSLTCTVDVSMPPVVQWIYPNGTTVTSDNGIVVGPPMRVGNITNLTLTFNSLLTSHRGQYTCRSKVDTVMSVQNKIRNITVEFPSPIVTVTTEPPTYIGTNTTLNCSITLNDTVDTIVDTNWVNVTWMGPQGPIFSRSGVVISNVTGSNNVYESTLMFSPLMSTANGDYTCEAIIIPVPGQFLLMSSPGRGIDTITTQDLPPPEVSISRAGNTTAGEMFALTCSVTVVENLYTPPAVEWRYSNGSLNTSGGNIEVEGPLSSGRMSNLTLRFNQIRTSDGGLYNCQASITIPLAAISDLTNASAVNVTVQVPRPQITISGSPTNGSFFPGILFNLTCYIQLNPAVDTKVSVIGMWNRSGTPLMNDSRITVFGTSGSASNQLLYQTRVQFNPLSGVDDDLFTCEAVVEPQSPHTAFVVGTSAVNERQINVTDEPPPPTVTITSDRVPVAGNMYTLTCMVTENLTADAVVMWLDSTGDPINLEDTLVGNVSQNGNTSTLQLTFNPLRTSHGQKYICTARIHFLEITSIPDTSSNTSFPVTVLIPQPNVTISRNHSGILYAGTSLTLSCSIQLSSSVDTNVNISHKWTGPGSQEVNNTRCITVSDLNSMNVTTVEFSPLNTTDTGNYICEALIIPDPESDYINMSMLEVDIESITVEALPDPQLGIRPDGVSTAGGMYSLTCTTGVVENLAVEPTVEWQFSNGSIIVGGNGISVGNPLTSDNTITLTLTFNPLRTSHGRNYTCSADVTAKSVTLSSNNTVADVIVQISAPTVRIRAVQPQPYNGTYFNLSCTIVLSPTVDTGVNVTGTWFKSGVELTTNDTTCITVSDTQLIMFNPPTYQTLLQFEPLGNNPTDGGMYVCEATVIPYPDAQFVTNTTVRDQYHLDVQALPLPGVSFTASSGQIVSGGRYSLTCIIQVVRFLANQPDVTWLDASGGLPLGNGFTVGQPRRLNNTTTLRFTIDRLDQSHLGVYTCRACVSIDKAAIQGHCNNVTAQITLEVPSSVQNLQAGSVSDNSVNVTWQEPVTANGIVNYTIEVRQYTTSTGRDLMLVSLDPEVKRSIPVSMLSPVGEVFTYTIAAQGLSAFVPFSANVTAVNLAGPGDSTDVVFFTREGAPDTAPQIVNIERLNGTTMNVSWVPLNLVEARGFVQSYFITYEPASGGSRRKRQQQTAQVNGSASSGIVGGLQPGVAYNVRVSGQTTVGPPGPSSPVARAMPEVTPVPPSEGSGAVVAGVIVALVVALLIIIVVVIVAYFLYKSRRKGEVSIKARRDEYEMKPKQPRTSSVKPLMSSMKRAEKEAETAIEKPPPLPSTEAIDRMVPISIASFRSHVEDMHSERDRRFEAEYQSLGSEPIAAHDVAKLPYNRPKNRFANIFPYDFSRVKLQSIPQEEGSDYINACYMQGYNRENAYIAAQGPMPNTTSDFWRMIWEKRLPNIVILTKCIEAGRHKCEQYWGDNIGDDFETPDKKLTITTTSVMPLADFDIRTFTVKSNENPDAEPLSVTQYHFTSWPDHGVPKFATSLIAFIRRVQRGHNKDDGHPLLVHCSAGVGRTGTFILLDSMLERMKVEDSVNVYEFLHNLRTKRVLMVQTLAQYVFIHDALDELITCGETDIPAAGLRVKVNHLKKTIPGSGITGFARQFKLLDQVSRKPDEDDFSDAQEYYNVAKNRYPDKLPYNMSRARLRPTGEDGSEYINASFVDGYKRRNAYIATQAPLKETVNDFWRMIWEFKSKSIVMVCNMVEDNQETCYPYWPSKEGETVKYGKIVVTMHSKAAYGDFSVRKFNLQEDKGQGSQVEGFQVTQFHHTEWPEHGNLPSAAGLIDLIDMLMKSQMNTGNRAITVMCNDGVGRTGTFICFHAQLERLKTEGVVDIFQSIKSIRIQRAGLVPQEEQFVYCHEVLADYVDKFDKYANFKDMI